METHDPLRLGDLVRRHRTAAALSQEELAERAGLSVRAISDLERGLRRAPRLETMRMLADALALGEGDRAVLLAAARPARVRSDAADRPWTTSLAMPAPLTRLIGREAEIATLRTLLQHKDIRLVTLSGAGGTGKTRLAIAVAAGMGDVFPDGIVFVDLSPLTDPALVVPTIAATLGVREVVGERLLDALGQALAPAHMLLLLDNCERVLATAPEITVLLAASPDLTVLATSREPFHVRGEYEFPLLPLPLPETDRLPAIEALAGVPAVALFVERAAATQLDFALTPDNAAAVAAICQRLDGLPLAIELAAARIKALPPAALLARLEHRLPLLTGGGSDLPARQRTMRDAIAWSYELLQAEEQALFRRLAVFAGGFTLEAAEAVAGPDAADPVLDGVIALLEQSLVRRVTAAADEPRYQMLETVREFGLERLAASGEEKDARRRHGRHFLRLSDDLARGLTILMDQTTLNRVIAEHDNLRLALGWFDYHGETEALLRLSSMLFGLWLGRGLYREGMWWVERALERSQRVPSVALVQALDAAGTLTIFQGNYDRAEPFVEEALALAQELGDPILVGEAMTYVAWLAYRRREFPRAEELFAEASRRLGGSADPGREVITFFTLGDLALAQGQLDRAAKEYGEAVEHFRASGNDYGTWDMQAGLAAVRYLTGAWQEAAALYWQSLERSHLMNYSPLVVSALLGLAGIAVETGQPEVGARLLGAAEGIATALGATMFSRDFPVRDRALAKLRSALGEERLAAGRGAGRALSVDDAVAEARRVAEAVTGAAPAVGAWLA